MASVGKCLGIMAGIGAVGGAGSSYFFQSKFDKMALAQAKSFAIDGMLPMGGRTKDGKMWDGKIPVDEFRKNLVKKRTILSVASGLAAAVGTTLISGIALALRGKIK